MKMVFDAVFDEELRKYLLTQEGINNVELIVKDFISELIID